MDKEINMMKTLHEILKEKFKNGENWHRIFAHITNNNYF